MVKNDYKKILVWGAKSKARIIQKMLEDMGERVSFLYDSYLDYPEFETNAQFSNSKKDLIGSQKDWIIGKDQKDLSFPTFN